MRIRLTLRRDPADAKDLAVTVDGLATVADIATQLWAADPARRGTPPPSNLSLSIEEAFAAGGMKGSILDRTDNLLESGLRPGSIVSLTQLSEQFATPGVSRGPAAATLRVLSGPDVGREFSLPSGTSYIGRGRDADVRLTDPSPPSGTPASRSARRSRSWTRIRPTGCSWTGCRSPGPC